MRTLNLYEDDSVLNDNATEKFKNLLDETKEIVEDLKNKISSFSEFASNYADNDLDKQQLATK